MHMHLIQLHVHHRWSAIKLHVTWNSFSTEYTTLQCDNKMSLRLIVIICNHEEFVSILHAWSHEAYIENHYNEHHLI